MKANGYFFVKEMGNEITKFPIPSDLKFKNYSDAINLLSGMKDKLHNITGFLFTLVNEKEKEECPESTQ